MITEPCDRFEWERLIRRIVMPAAVKFVALTLATYADGDGTRVRPGTRRLMNVTGYSKSTIVRSLNSLRDSGLIEKAGEKHAGGRGGAVCDEYRLVFPALSLPSAMLGPDEELVSPVTLVPDRACG